MLPLLAVIAPVIVASVAVTAPALVTRNGALPAVALPIHSRYVLSAADAISISLLVPSVRLPALLSVTLLPASVVLAIAHPPTVPLAAVIEPVKLPLVA